MPKINLKEIEAAYEKGVAVHQGKMSFADAIESLHNDYLMNFASAADYIGNVGNLLNGKLYKRTFNLTAAKYFLGRIAADFPASVLSNAVSAIKLHIEYYQTVSNTKLHQLAALCDEYLTSGIVAHVQLTKLSADFETETQEALLLSPKQRQERSQLFPEKPNSVLVVSSAFIRNPYVKADVLFRAGGKCEACDNVGPFMRKSNCEPYLEVHHITPLSEGGNDTIANAIAICPNCHREAHLGVNWQKFRTLIK